MNKQELYDYLKNNGIEYEVTEHAPVYTMQDLLEAQLPYPEKIAKNLFLRDSKKQNYYLITVGEKRAVNLKEFQAQFGTAKLSFASENDLSAIMKLTKGSVTPFGILNDLERKVQFFVGKEFLNKRMGLHPNENTATVWIRTSDVIKLVEEHGNHVAVF